MADNPIVYRDDEASAVSFAPEATQQGNTSAGLPVLRPMFGLKDGAFVTFGSESDAAWDSNTASATFMAIMKAMLAIACVTTAATPAATTLQAKAAAGRFTHLAVVNDTTSALYAVVVDATAAPQAGVAIPAAAIKRVLKVPAASGQLSDSGFAETDKPFAFATGCLVLLSTSYLAYNPPANFAGLISASTV